MSKQYFYIFFFIYTNIYFITSLEISKPYVNSTINKQINPEINLTSSIPSEGGGKINTEPVINHQGREHIHSSSTYATSIEKTISAKNTTISPISASANVAGTTANMTNSKFLNGSMVITNHNSSTTEMIKPVSETEEIVGDSKVKPRKGVTFSDIVPTSSTLSTTNTSTKADITNSSSISTATTKRTTTTTTTTTTTKKPTTTLFIPRKPTVTFGSDDDVPARLLPKVFINNKEVLPKNYTNPPPKLITDDNPMFISGRTQKGPDYVLPIILIILSVPLLAIIFTVIYKRGAEWWHHRHYRRMDFLIDGMYNN